MKKISIAIDGPAGAGKSSVSKEVSKRLNYIYIDTGSMYRAITFAILEQGIDFKDRKALENLLKTTKIELSVKNNKHIISLNGKDVTNDIRSVEVNKMVSMVAKINIVRKEMVKLQQNLAKNGGVVLDGRDIGTIVLPKAELKVFLTANIKIRAKRRWLEIENRDNIKIEDIESSIIERDTSDQNRELSPLRRAEDAVLIDNSNLSFEETVDKILQLVEEKLK